MQKKPQPDEHLSLTDELEPQYDRLKSLQYLWQTSNRVQLYGTEYYQAEIRITIHL